MREAGDNILLIGQSHGRKGSARVQEFYKLHPLSRAKAHVFKGGLTVKEMRSIPSADQGRVLQLRGQHTAAHRSLSTIEADIEAAQREIRSFQNRLKRVGKQSELREHILRDIAARSERIEQLRGRLSSLKNDVHATNGALPLSDRKIHL